MAMIRTARAKVKASSVSPEYWMQVRQQSTKPFALEKVASAKVVLDEYDPSKYLLSHCTIVASVDTENSNLPLGKHMVNGVQIDRTFPDFYVTANTEKYINNNKDGFERKLLLSSFRTFIGAQNYCFVPGTMIVMSDGTQKPIETVVEGDTVLTHLGRPRKVVKTFERQVDEDLCDVFVDRYKAPISCTKEHPFRALTVNCPDPRRYSTGTVASAARYKRDNIRKYLRDGEGWLQGKVSTKEDWVSAGSLETFNFLLGPAPSHQSGGTVAEGVLLGYYLAEGCLASPKCNTAILTFGSHEESLVLHAQALAIEVFGVSTKTRVTSGQGTLQLFIRGDGVGDWFHTHGGEFSHLKKISSEVMSWSREALLGLLAGYSSGDGSRHKKTRRVVTASTSESLSSQIVRVCDIVGVKASLWRELPESFQKRKLLFSTISLLIAGKPRDFKVQAKHTLYNVTISKDSVYLFSGLTPRWESVASDSSRKREDFSWYRGHHVHSVRDVETRRYSGPVYNFEVEEDNSYVLGLAGIAVHNCEHVQVPELSKGKIIDAAARDIGDSVYIDILVATERKHVQLVKDIASGVMSTLSMGAQISFSICTFCGNVAYDEAQLCPHVKYAKGTTFIDANGQQRIVAELCGHVSADGSVKFIEASWVGIPAFTGAVVRGLLEESPGQVINAALEDKIRLSFQSNRVEDLSKVRKVASQQQQQMGGEDSTQAPPPEAPESSSLSKPSEDLYKALVESVKSKVETELANADKKKTEDIMDSNRSNESMVKSAALVQSALAYPKWQRRAKAILSQTSDLGRARKILAGLYLLDMGGVAEVARTRLFTGSELLGIVRMRDHFEKKSSFAGESRMNSVVISVGSMRKFATTSGYLEACSKVLGRQPNKMEEMRLLEKGQIFSLGT